MEKINILELNKSFGSYKLKEELKNRIKENDFIVCFAYTDYGGEFFDKVAIEYFKKHYPENILIENTVYSGKNCFFFGEVAREFWQASEDNFLNFENLEDFYMQRISEQENEDFIYFIDNELKDKFLFNYDNVLNYLLEEKSGYYNITTQGIDFCWQSLTEELLKNNIISNEYEKLLYLFLNNNYEKSIAEYYVTTYENGNIKSLSLNEKTLSIIQDYENTLANA
jgi:hypothetical protein